MIDTHRFAAYILLYLFSGGFRGTSLFTNEAMFFITCAVSPVSILQKSNELQSCQRKKFKKTHPTHLSSEVLYWSFRRNNFFCCNMLLRALLRLYLQNYSSS